MKQGIAEWSEKNQDILNIIQIAKTDLMTTKGLDEMVEHYLKEHNGNIDGLKESFAKAKIRLVDD